MGEERYDLLVVLGARGIADLLREVFYPFRSDTMSRVTQLAAELLEARRAFSVRGVLHRFHHRGNLDLEVFEQILKSVDITTETVEGAGSIENFHNYQIGFGR